MQDEKVLSHDRDGIFSTFQPHSSRLESEHISEEKIQFCCHLPDYSLTNVACSPLEILLKFCTDLFHQIAFIQLFFLLLLTVQFECSRYPPLYFLLLQELTASGHISQKKHPTWRISLYPSPRSKSPGHRPSKQRLFESLFMWACC